MAMRTTSKLYIITFITLGLIMSQSINAQRPFVKDFDLNRYLGTWYEIARFPHSFEKDLVGVTATYSLRPDGNVRVENAGYKGTLDGKRDVAVGKAKLAGNPDEGHLKVSFFLFFYADYFIMEMDPEYRWALIGSKSDNYLWILSRTPFMDDGTYNMILDRAQSLGYDLTRLYKVPQRDITPSFDKLVSQ
jgi:apolipoprotein D and lipocalin family protein